MAYIKHETLALIPAREHSKRIPGKNTRRFCGKPLLAHAIEHAFASPHISRTIVATESERVAAIAKKCGAEVPFLRPHRLAADTSDVIRTIFYFLNRLEQQEGYRPTRLVVLQATSPLRVLQDIDDCVRLMEQPGVTAALTVAPTHPKLYHLGANGFLKLVNGSEKKTSRTQAWPKAYLLNGCAVYIVSVDALYREKRIITKNTKAVIMPKWRSIDLDEPEEWAMAEVLYKNQNQIEKIIKNISSNYL